MTTTTLGCARCGTVVDPTAAFCATCGTSLNERPAPPAFPPPAAPPSYAAVPAQSYLQPPNLQAPNTWAPPPPTAWSGPGSWHSPPAGSDGLGIASLVLSLVWLFGLGSIAAVVLGHLARSKAKRVGRQP